MMVFTRSFPVILILWVFSAIIPAHAQGSPIALSDIIGAKVFPQFETLRASPDGTLVAFTVQDQKRVAVPWSDGTYLYTKTGVPVYLQGTDIYASDLRTRTSVKLTSGSGSNWAPVWSKDGRQLAYFSDRGGVAQLWIWDRYHNSARRVASQTVHPWSGDAPIWLGQDHSILVPALPSGVTLAQSNAQALDVPGIYRDPGAIVRVYRYNPNDPKADEQRAPLQGYYASDNGVLRDFVSVDVSTGKARRLFSSTGYMAGVSADGSIAALSEMVGAAPDAFDQSLFDIRVASLTSGNVRTLVSNVPMGYGSTVSWSPKSHMLAYVSSSVSPELGLTSNRYGKIGECYVIDADTGKSRLITKGIHPNLGFSSDAPLWDASGNDIYFLVNNQLLKANLKSERIQSFSKPSRFSLTSLVHDKTGLFRPSEDTFASITDGQDQGFAWSTSGFSGFKKKAGWPERLQDPIVDGHRLIFASESEVHPQDLWMFDFITGQRSRLSNLNPVLEQSSYGARRIIRWRTKNGTKANGLLILPTTYQAGRQYPTIIYQYPWDMKSEQLHYFDDSYFYAQLLTSRGYAVFEPDFPIKKIADLMNGKALALFDPMLDKLVETGVSDPRGFGIIGTSGGGQSTLALITQTNRFAAAVEDSGLASEFTLFTDLYRNGDAFYVQQQVRNFGGTPWTARKAYIDASPFFALDKVHTPLLIIHGDFDGALGRKNADDIFVSLRSLGREVSYALYVNGGHTLSTFSFSQKLDAWRRIIAWFDAHLKSK